jgi:hypothetical protein
MVTSLFRLCIRSGSMGIPFPLKRKNALDGPVATIGGVDGGGSSRLVSSRSMSLSEHSEGVGASVTEEGGHEVLAEFAGLLVRG